MGYINYCLKSEVSITQLCSTRYIAVQIKNCLKSTSAIKVATKVATIKNTNNYYYEGKLSRPTAKSTLFAVNGMQRRSLVSP